ncbi:DNA-directed RNA polymerase subunit delta [Alteribacter keqinensis]|uniref:Probable DNA-directed RNA polymerase subunit delta n=1 Tax=Alteribacter keqinensis TaxID=2483800 RepID=A0A3M7TQJ1_9BACI|nr:DNA-directed RNA polymerase subunit delta [Alteribacter keqinensis]RNA67844.1 DNA-directed RNA polymerase subunit delta [Alteribacter keqinensis]
MSFKQYNDTQLKELSMLEIAYELLKEKKGSEEYHVLLKQVAGMKEISDADLKDRIANLYTEMSLDGRFVNLGDNKWGLRSWYPFDQTEEELSQTNKPKKKKLRASADEDDDIFGDHEEDFDEFEDLEDELDELANEEDEDFEDLDEEDEFDGEEDEEDLDSEDEEDR